MTAEEEPRPMIYDSHDKKTLVLSARAAVEKLVTHFSSASSQQEKVRLGKYDLLILYVEQNSIAGATCTSDFV